MQKHVQEQGNTGGGGGGGGGGGHDLWLHVYKY